MTARRAIVTGAAGGLGRAIVDRLHADGWHIAGIDRATWTDDRIAVITANLTIEAQAGPAFAEALAALGGTDALVACAGLTVGAAAADTTEADWHAVLDANLTSAFLSAKHVLPAMTAAGGGVIVTIGSVLGHHAAPGLTAYAAAKAGLVALTRQIAVDYGQYGVRAVTISPGWIRTAETSSRLADSDDEAKLIEAHPLRRLGGPSDVAAAVAFAISAEAGMLTGTEIVLDGGSSAVQAASLLRKGMRRRLGLEVPGSD